MNETLSATLSKELGISEKVLGYIIEDLHWQRLPRKIRNHYSVDDDQIKRIADEFNILYIPFEKK